MDVERQLSTAGLTVIRADSKHDLNELAATLPYAVGWIAGVGPITATHLDLAPHLQIIARYGVGVENVDITSASERGVIVTNTPGANSAAVADLAVGLLITASRRIVSAHQQVRVGDWSPVRGCELNGMTVGIVGLGRIGSAVVNRLRAFGTTILGCDPSLDEDTIARLGATPCAQKEFPAKSDAVSIHTPGGQQVVTEKWISGLRTGAILVNTARADVVDEEAVAAAIRSGSLAMFAADTVTECQRSPLLSEDLTDRVIITPHIGGQTNEAIDRMGESAVTAILEHRAGRVPEFTVAPPRAPIVYDEDD